MYVENALYISLKPKTRPRDNLPDPLGKIQIRLELLRYQNLPQLKLFFRQEFFQKKLLHDRK